jgi:glucosamine--fructose-6-phosphate aminotransferase (isomerizing)
MKMVLKTNFMCGIVGYVGKRSAKEVLLDGLKRLEYRGYDSAGLTVVGQGLRTVRAKGEVSVLEEKTIDVSLMGTCGIAHTRWATHGAPEERNAHPHQDCFGEIAVVHNGIIENFAELKAGLEARGHVFTSDTDTEVLPHLLEEARKEHEDSRLAVQEVLSQVRGAYGLAVVFADAPETIIVARMGSPLVIGIGEGEHFVASDPSALVQHTKQLVFLDDQELAVISPNSLKLYGFDASELVHKISEIDWDVEDATKAGYAHFMLKEMFEQPEVIRSTLRGRIDAECGRVVLGGLSDVQNRLSEIDRLVIVGCGSAYYAGLVGEYLIESLAGIPVEVELASEFRYRKPVLTQSTAVLAISQSGETADTLEAVREAKRKQVLTLGLVNTVGSTIARETDAGVYNHAGPEIGVASTKAFVSQVVAMVLIALTIAQQRGTVSCDRVREILNALERLPDDVEEVLSQHGSIRRLVEGLGDFAHAFFLGRTLHAPIAYEAALKLKEVSYVHAQGYSSGELKHGPIALIDEGFVCVAFAPAGELLEKNRSNIEEIKARGAQVVGVSTPNGLEHSCVQHLLTVPETDVFLQPILSLIPMQLFAYEVAIERGINPDKPRNLAKSVTVE